MAEQGLEFCRHCGEWPWKVHGRSNSEMAFRKRYHNQSDNKDGVMTDNAQQQRRNWTQPFDHFIGTSDNDIWSGNRYPVIVLYCNQENDVWPIWFSLPLLKRSRWKGDHLQRKAKSPRSRLRSAFVSWKQNDADKSSNGISINNRLTKPSVRLTF